MTKLFLPFLLTCSLAVSGCFMSSGTGPKANAVRGLTPVHAASHHMGDPAGKVRGALVTEPRLHSEPAMEQWSDGNTGLSYTFIQIEDETKLPPMAGYEGGSQVPSANYRYLYSESIQERDQLEIRFTDASTQSPFYRPGAEFIYGPVEVPADGVLAVPYLNQVNVLGKQLSALSRELSATAQKVSSSAEVAVRRSGRLPLRVFVVGGVHEPGAVEIDRQGFSMLDALSSAGGSQESEHLYRYVLNRNGSDYPLSTHQLLRGDILAQDGDVLRVKRDYDRAFQALGSIKATGRYEFADDSPTLIEAMAQCGGLNGANSNPRGVFIFRQTPTGARVVYGIDMMDPNGTFLAHNFYMYPGDILYVSESPLQQWKRVMTVALPAIGVAALLGR